MNVFAIRERLISDYETYVSSFLEIRDPRIREYGNGEIAGGLLWPDPLIQPNPSFEPGASIDEFVGQRVLHDQCRTILQLKPERGSQPRRFPLHLHQEEAIRPPNCKPRQHHTLGACAGHCTRRLFKRSFAFRSVRLRGNAIKPRAASPVIDLTSSQASVTANRPGFRPWQPRNRYPAAQSPSLQSHSV